MVVQRLLFLLQEVSNDLRARAAAPLVEALVAGTLDPADADAAEAALTLLLDDPEPAVRRALAAALAPHREAPRHLLLGLLDDDIEIAAVVATGSPALLDAELIDIVATRGPGLQAAVAARRLLSPAVSAALAEVGDGRAAAALLRNTGADLTDASFRRIAERFGSWPGVREALFAREDLPIVVRQDLIAALAARLHQCLSDTPSVSAERARILVRDARDKANAILAGGAPADDLAALVEHLRATGQLTTSLLLRGICAGNIALLEVALSQLAGVPLARVFAILSEGREAATLALLQRAGLPARSHPAFLAALGVWRDMRDEDEGEGGPRFARRMIERILTRYQGFADDELDDLLAMLRQIAAETAREAALDYAEAVLAA